MDIDFGALLPLLLAAAYLILTAVAASKKKASSKQKSKPTKSPFETFLNELRQEFDPTSQSSPERPVELLPPDYERLNEGNPRRDDEHFLADQFATIDQAVSAEDSFENHSFFEQGDLISDHSMLSARTEEKPAMLIDEPAGNQQKPRVAFNLKDKTELQKAIVVAEIVGKPRSKGKFGQ